MLCVFGKIFLQIKIHKSSFWLHNYSLTIFFSFISLHVHCWDLMCSNSNNNNNNNNLSQDEICYNKTKWFEKWLKLVIYRYISHIQTVVRGKILLPTCCWEVLGNADSSGCERYFATFFFLLFVFVIVIRWWWWWG